MKKLLLILSLLVSYFNLNSQDTIQNISDITFNGVNIEESSYKDIKDENKKNYTIIFSPILPEGAVYSIIDKESGREAVIQIGRANVNNSPFILYMPAYLYTYFTSAYTDKKDKISLKIKFLAWNKKDNEADSLNLSNLIVKLEDSYGEISKNGFDKYYIQLGSFSFYQNSYPLISEMMPYLKIVPKFYLVKKVITVENNEKKDTYRLLVGPYSIEDAKEISQKININKKVTVFIHSGDVIIKEYGLSPNGDK